MEEDTNNVVDANVLLGSMKGRLVGASPSSVELFFINRHKRKRKEENRRLKDQNLGGKKGNNNPASGDYEITYEVLQTDITWDVGLVLEGIGENKMDGLLKIDGLCLRKYSPGIVADQSVIEQIEASKVDHFPKIYKDMQSLGLDSYNIKDNGVPWAMAVHIRDAGLVLFRKFTPGRILENAGLIPLFVRDGVFNRLDEPALTVDKEVDCIYDTRNKRIYIFNRDQFEIIFSFMEVFMEKVESKKPTLEQLNLVDNTNLLVELSKNDPKKVRKLYSILESKTLALITPDTLDDVCNQYVLDLEFNRTRQIIVKQKDLWSILRALDDAYLLSTSTLVRYDVYSKEALPRIRIVGPPCPQVCGKVVTINGNVINADTVTWDWGDGSTGETSHPDFFPTEHTYKAAGEYTITANAQGKHGSVKKETEIKVVGSTINSTATQSVPP
ncbi:MAG: DUF4868 domain-containing protein [Theionarchaea archaeon]|nr:DUF4868 domain-containing protein [Theionarchaea archaeon]MBU7037445.1 DUF4868 domain-containing protein [Theionarchaea archaeon]